jgi:hypothetical protein
MECSGKRREPAKKKITHHEMSATVIDNILSGRFNQDEATMRQDMASHVIAGRHGKKCVMKCYKVPLVCRPAGLSDRIPLSNYCSVTKICTALKHGGDQYLHSLRME